MDYVQAAAKIAEATGILSKEVETYLQLNIGALKPCVIACSGGSDSVFLTLWMYGHYPECREELTLIHFNHQLRGEASEQDEGFVRHLASHLGARFISQRGGCIQGEKHISEENLRNERHAFFEQVLKDLGGRVLFLGQQKDDIVETMLMRIARGSGTEGLSAPHPVTRLGSGVTYLRPLLGITKKKIQVLLKEIAIEWREDASNQQNGFLRNRIRNQLMPLWESLSLNNVVEGAAASREFLEEDDMALRSWLHELLPVIEKGGSLKLDRLVTKPKALVRRALYQWFYAQGLKNPLSKSGFDVLLCAVLRQEDLKLNLAEGVTLVLKDSILWLSEVVEEEIVPRISLELEYTYTLPGGKVLEAKKIAMTEGLRVKILGGGVDSRERVYVDASKVKFPLAVRGWEAGDFYHKLGAKGSKKLQDHFVDGQIPQERRHQLPLIIDGEGNIIWVPGLPPSEKAKIENKTNQALQLTYALIC